MRETNLAHLAHLARWAKTSQARLMRHRTQTVHATALSPPTPASSFVIRLESIQNRNTRLADLDCPGIRSKNSPSINPRRVSTSAEADIPTIAANPASSQASRLHHAVGPFRHDP